MIILGQIAMTIGVLIAFCAPLVGLAALIGSHSGRVPNIPDPK